MEEKKEKLIAQLKKAHREILDRIISRTTLENKLSGEYENIVKEEWENASLYNEAFKGLIEIDESYEMGALKEALAIIEEGNKYLKNKLMEKMMNSSDQYCYTD